MRLVNVDGVWVDDEGKPFHGVVPRDLQIGDMFNDHGAWLQVAHKKNDNGRISVFVTNA